MNVLAGVGQLQGNTKLRTILDEAHDWSSYRLHGESIPHLLHWDFAYLWILQRYSTRPQSWDDRVEAWRRLVCMLLLGELQLERQTIEWPLRRYTEPFGISDVVFVRAQGFFGERVIGVLSPTVLVRPLPEPNRTGIDCRTLADSLPKHYDPPSTLPDRRGELSQMFLHAKRAIENTGAPLAQTLIPILERELDLQRVAQRAPIPVVPLSVNVPLLPAADSSAWQNVQFHQLTLMVPQGAIGPRLTFVPKCGCGRPLLFGEAAPAVIVDDSVRIQCRCGQNNAFDLNKLGIWVHHDSAYVLQDLEHLEGLAQVELPPRPDVRQDEVHFQWNPAFLGGEHQLVHLRLRFQRHQVQAVRIADIKYRTLLVPGNMQDFKGLPIRPEWMFAFAQLPTTELQNGILVFRNARLHGLPYPVTLGKYPAAVCKVLTDAQVGMYPGPMYPGWKRYRFFWSGTGTEALRMRVLRNRAETQVDSQHIPGTFEWHDDVPDAVALEENPHGDLSPAAGALWLLEKPQPNPAAQAVYIGVDFGTTNSVVFAQGQDTNECVIEHRDVVAAANLLGGTGTARAGFLPTPSDRGQFDLTLFPSALWFLPNQTFNPICWSDQPPAPNYGAVHGFKWGREYELHRRKYLSELVFLTLPAALKKLFPAGSVKGNWNVGFAFPLAFDATLRADYQQMFNGLQHELNTYTSGPVDIRSINESYACVRATGVHLIGTTFLIADLGGGSLDVALFELEQNPQGAAIPRHYQVGSAKIGGEVFVNALASMMANDEPARKRHYWDIRKAIMCGRVGYEFPGANFSGISTRFIPVAQEFLRLMLETFRHHAQDRSVKLVLAGNGWRIMEFTAATPLSEQAGRRELEKWFADFELPFVSVYAQPLPPHPKHLVAIGALKNSKPDGRREIGEAFCESMMPSGRDIRLTNTGGTIHWWDLIGGGIANLPLSTGRGNLDLVRESGPEVPARWRNQLEHALPNLQNDPPNAQVCDRLPPITAGRLEKGPLQVILEMRAEAIK